MRSQVGRDFCVGLRMCGDEFHEDGISHEMAKEIAQAMAESGLVDFLSVVGSGADTHNTLANCMPPMALPPEPFVHLAAGIKSVVKIPVMHAQSIRDASQAERILAAGMVDMVGMTRAQIADPHLVIKIRDGREDQIKQCVGANYCIDRQYMGLDVLCIQNAATSREQTMPHVFEKAAKRRKVVVVGAGPAGLEAARVARERGHDVVLFEKHGQVGGQVNLAAKAPQREQMAGIIRWFDLETLRLGVERRLGVTADVSMIMDERPDIVVLATGGSPNLGPGRRLGRGRGARRQRLGHPRRHRRPGRQRAGLRRDQHPCRHRSRRLHRQPRPAGRDGHARRQDRRRHRRHDLPDVLSPALCERRDPDPQLLAESRLPRRRQADRGSDERIHRKRWKSAQSTRS